MHVLVIPSWYPASAQDISGSFFREQAIALAKRINKVGLIFPNLRPLTSFSLLRQTLNVSRYENDNGVHTYRGTNYNWTPRIQAGILLQWQYQGLKIFEEYVREHGKPDVIHAHCMLFAGALAIKISKRHNIPVVITEHSTGYGRKFYSRLELFTAKWVARSSNRLIAVSKDLAQKLQAIAPNSRQNWEVVPNIVNDAFLNTKLNQGKGNDRFTFINAAILRPNKRQSLLIQAFEEAFPGDDTVCLKIVGSGPEYGNLEKQIKAQQRANRIQLTGHIDRAEMPRVLSLANAFVLSSELETFGVVLVEALATGLPVISTKCGGPDHIVDVNNGYLVPPNDAPALAAALRQLRADYSLFDSSAIRSECAKKYSENAVCEKLASIYKTTILEFPKSS